MTKKIMVIYFTCDIFKFEINLDMGVGFNFQFHKILKYHYMKYILSDTWHYKFKQPVVLDVDKRCTFVDKMAW